jgi:hypothetical protein
LTVQDAAVLDLGLLPEFAHHGEPGKRAGNPLRHKPVQSILVLLFAVIVGAVLLVPQASGLSWGQTANEPAVRFAFDDIPTVANMSVDDKSQIVVEGLAAQERNAAIPVSGLPLDHPARFALTGSVTGDGNATALRCMTQAVYYEAATEPMQGRRAVAQVILNRMRHPAYPNSVCGVIYQGSERQTGCQFSFTCDGSLLRAPAAMRWKEAEAVARAALAGYIEPSVGTATHYHADYVLPKWAFQLSKITQLGRHIFYRFNGGAGRSASFSDRYSGIEQIPPVNFEMLRLRALANPEVLPAIEELTPGLTVTPHITDRHSETDVGGRLDTTKGWRPSIPDPTETISSYKQVVEQTTTAELAPHKVAVSGEIQPVTQQ